MIEIAISLAIIGIALVGIIGVLPLGLNTQRVTRETTVINQDATVFMQNIRNGARGADDLTNYVYAIVITKAASQNVYINPPLAGAMGFSTANLPPTPPIQSYPILTNGANIIGLLSTPEYTDLLGDPTNALGGLGGNSLSNHVVAYVRSLNGPAFEKPPQDNPILQQDSFSYRIYCVNAPFASADPNSSYGKQLNDNLHELRLTFIWPVLPNGGLPAQPFRATYRTLVAGQVAQDAVRTNLYSYQPQSFTIAP